MALHWPHWKESQEGVEAINQFLIDKEIPEPQKDIDKPFLMFVEDVLTITGRSAVEIGGIERGTIKVGEEVEINLNE